MLKTSIAGSLPRPGWLAEPETLKGAWKLSGQALEDGKRKAATDWLRHQEEAGMNDAYKDYLCEYPFGGQHWAFTIRAASHDEAEARLKAIGWGEVKGESGGSLPGWLPAWIANLMCWWRNR